MTIGAIVAFSFAGSLPGENVYHNLVTQSKDGNTYVYVVNSQSDSNGGYEIFTSDKPEVVKNGQLQVWDYHDGNVLLYLLGGILIYWLGN